MTQIESRTELVGKRVAFLTPEFPTESIGSLGGLSNYLGRCSSLLKQAGCEVEVFTQSESAGEIEYRGVRVHRVPPSVTLDGRAEARLTSAPGKLRPHRTLECLLAADAIARKFEIRHQEFPFELVQSSDYNFPGLYVPPRPGLTHIVRCSLSTSWLNSMRKKRWGIGRPHDQWALRYFERRLFRQVSGVYAPSQQTASDFTQRYGIKVQVVRPPFFIETIPSQSPAMEIPEKFFLFVGHLNRAKGIDVLAQAMSIAVNEEPTMKMVWVGGGNYDQQELALGTAARNVTYLGKVAKAETYALMKRALAVVAPSRTDNLSNVVLESVSLGTPVIGSDGASMDEIIEPERNGILVPIGSPEALAEAMIKAWRGEVEWTGAGFVSPAILEEVSPNRALDSLLEFGGLLHSSKQKSSP